MAGQQIVNDVIINYKSVGLDKVGSEIKQASVALDGLVVSATGSEKAVGSIENRFKSLERTLGTSGGNAQKFAKDQETINKAVAQNPALQDRANEALAASAAKYGIATKATEAHVNATKLQRYEMVNLGRQIQDVGVSLFSGQSPLTVLVQQGTQVADISIASGVSMTNMFKQAGSAALSFITPVTAGIAAVASLTAAAAALAVQYDKVQVSAQRAISGSGARTGTTVSDLNAFVDKNTPSITSGTSLSQKESMALAQGLTQTGDIVISKLHSMSDAVVGFSNQSGKSMDESVKAFIAMGKEPVKAMDELAKVFGPFSQQTRDFVEAANVAGDKTGAWNVILDALGTTAKGAAENMEGLVAAGRGVSNFLGTAPRATGLEKQLADVTQQLNAAIESGTKWAQVGVAPPPEVSNSIAILSKKFEELYARQQAVIDQKVASQFNDVADKARVVTEALIPQIEQIKQMEAALNKLKAAQAQGGGGADLSAAITAQQNMIQLTKEQQAESARANEWTAAIAKSWGDVGQSTAIALDAAQTQLPVYQAVGAAAQMAAQYTADYATEMRKGKTETEAAALAGAKLAASQAQAYSASKLNVQQMADANNLAQAGYVSQYSGQTKLSELQYAKAQESAVIAQQKLAAQQAYNKAVQEGGDAEGMAAETARSYQTQIWAAADKVKGIQIAINEATAEWRAELLGVGSALTIIGADYAKIAAAQDQIDQATASYNAQLVASGQIGISGKDFAPDPNNTTATGVTALSNTSYQLYQIVQKMNAGGGFGKKPSDLVTGLGDLVPQGTTWGDLGLKGSDVDLSVPNAAETKALQDALDKLTKSTDGLTKSNEDLLSPYYTQDPRTSHIGFRSQGMASGGYVDVPGGISANDNMMAMIPVASGERIYVDPQSSRRGVGGGNTTITISAPITIGGNANADEVGRTVYQAMQSAGRQLQAAAR